MDDKNIRRHCIFCGETETSFKNGNKFTTEHIVPFALGNKQLKSTNVCKQCNSGLGTYVDNYVLDSVPVKMIRQEYQLSGQSGKVPNPFAKGKDKDGHTVFLDEQFNPHIQEYKEENENKIRIVAPTRDRAKKMLQKTLERKGFSQEKIDVALLNIDNVKPNCFQPELRYDFEIDLHRFNLEALKIGYEYAIYLLGEKYETDPKCIEIRDFLLKGIIGDYQNQCPSIPGVIQMDHALFQIVNQIPSPCHFLYLHADAQGFLLAEISLFKAEYLSYTVLLSEKASEYDLSGNVWEIIPILNI